MRVDGEKYFNLGKAYNLGFKLAKSKKIMKMDTDYFINPYYNLVEAQDGFHHQPWIIPRDSVITLDGLEAMRPHLRAQHGW